MGCSEIKAVEWSCCCMAKSRKDCKCWDNLFLTTVDLTQNDSIIPKPELKFIKPKISIPKIKGTDDVKYIIL